MSSTHPKKVLQYCPRCGKNHFQFQEASNSFLCQDCQFHFFVNCAGAVAIILTDEQNRVLLCRRAHDPNKGMMDLPGGFVDAMESAESAAQREVQEELGLELTSMNYLTSFPNEYVFSNYSVFTLDLAFICTVKTFEGMTPMDDIDALEFRNPHEVTQEEVCFPSIFKLIKAYADYLDARGN